MAFATPSTHVSVGDPVPILEVRDLSTHFFTDDGEVKAVRGVSFDVTPGETRRDRGRVRVRQERHRDVVTRSRAATGQGSARRDHVQGQDLLKLYNEELRNIRGRDIAMIFQDPLSSLNPVLRMGFQIDEAMRAHDKIPKRAVAERGIDLLNQVRVSGCDRIGSRISRTSSVAGCGSGP